MLNKENYCYNDGYSILHRINAVLKIIGVFVYLIICFLKFNNILFIFNISLVFLLLLLSNISLDKYFKIVWKLKYVLILLYVVLLRFGVNATNINILLFKLIFFLLYISMIIYTTTKEELASSLVRVLDRINIFGFNLNGIKLFFNNTFVYLELLIDSYNEILLEKELKGIKSDSYGFINKVFFFVENYKNIILNANNKKNKRNKDISYRLFDKMKKTKYKYCTRLNMFDYVYILLFISMIIFYIVRVR